MTEMLKEKELADLEVMRSTFRDEDGSGMPMNDNTYLRYLRARNFKTKKAVPMLHATIKWRKDFGLKDLHQWVETISVESKAGKMYARGFDKVGRVIVYTKPVKESYTSSHEVLLKHLIYNLERAITIMETATGKEKICLAMHYHGFSISNGPPFKTSLEILQILQNHYPERLHRAYIVRPPSVFSTFWSMISPFFDPVTKDKVVMLTAHALQSSDHALHRDIDKTILEPCMDGLDERPFDASIYLHGDYNKDFLTILNSLPLSKDEGFEDTMEGKIHHIQTASSSSLSSSS